jgi:hypothetical protein
MDLFFMLLKLYLLRYYLNTLLILFIVTEIPGENT